MGFGQDLQDSFATKEQRSQKKQRISLLYAFFAFLGGKRHHSAAIQGVNWTQKTVLRRIFYFL
jgi:hypothetical protein